MGKTQSRFRFGLTEERELTAVAAKNAAVETAAVKFNTSVETIQKTAKRLGISIKNGRLTKRSSPKPIDLRLKAKGK
jgi:L-2-hydroxyglutarate oxidase LhgO